MPYPNPIRTPAIPKAMIVILIPLLLSMLFLLSFDFDLSMGLTRLVDLRINCEANRKMTERLQVGNVGKEGEGEIGY
jgi:hypothetical protein